MMSAKHLAWNKSSVSVTLLPSSFLLSSLQFKEFSLFLKVTFSAYTQNCIYSMLFQSISPQSFFFNIFILFLSRSSYFCFQIWLILSTFKVSQKVRPTMGRAPQKTPPYIYIYIPFLGLLVKHLSLDSFPVLVLSQTLVFTHHKILWVCYLFPLNLLPTLFLAPHNKSSAQSLFLDSQR